MHIAAIDLGTSFIKGTLLNLDTMSLGEIHRLPFPEQVSGLESGFVEIDVGAVVAATRSLLDRLLAGAPPVTALVWCGQMGGVCLTDRTGRPVTRYISWRDERSRAAHPREPGTCFEAFCRRLSLEDRRRLGQEVRAGYAPSLLYCLVELNQLPTTRDLMPVSLPDVVASQLCGMPPVTEFTLALGGLDVEARHWHLPLLERLRLAQLSWPRLTSPFEPLGECRIGAHQLRCFPPIGDHQCSLAGTLLDESELSLNVSTGSQVSRLSHVSGIGDFQTRPYLDGRFLRTITHLPAGRSLNVLVRLLEELAENVKGSRSDPWTYINDASSLATSNGLTADLAFFTGPMGETGAIRGIREDNLTVGSLFRAAFENMADNYAVCSNRVSPDNDWQRIVFSGGLVQKLSALQQAILGRFTCPYRYSPHAEDSLLGLLALALVVSGRASDLAGATQVLRDRFQAV